MRFWFAVDDAREYPQEVLKSENRHCFKMGLESIMKNTRFEAGSAENIIRYRVKEPIVAGKLIKERLFYHREEEMLNASPFILV